MKSRITILFLMAALILIFTNACSTSSTSVTAAVTTTAKTTTETTSVAEQQYYEEIIRISNALTNSTGIYYQACDDFLNLDIDLSGHKKATDDFIRAVLVLSTAYGKLEPLENYKTAHDLLGTSLEYFKKGAEYLNQYIEASGDDMNTYLEKAIPEIEQAANYLNQAKEEIKK